MVDVKASPGASMGVVQEPDEIVIPDPAGRSPIRIARRELTVRTLTSGGPGGQHANRSATRVELRLDLSVCGGMSDDQRRLLIERLGPVVRVGAGDERSQHRNRVIAERRLVEVLAGALRVERARRPTRPSRGSVERRLSTKRRRSETKASRRRPEH